MKLQLTLCLSVFLIASSVMAKKNKHGAKAESTVNVDDQLHLTTCPGTTPSITIDTLDLSPNPPKPNTDLLIKIAGDFKDGLKQGTQLVTSYSKKGRVLLSQTSDFCDIIDKEDPSQCPLAAGNHSLVAILSMPRFIPKGTYDVKLNLLDSSGVELTCLEGSTTISH
ncbi:ML domain-containing protein [Spinellus fusiger]|nr:ML domain-containing protein [Spinellus fusiger]